MTRAEFLNSLYRRLGALEKEQAEQYLTYYAEMLMDRMEEGMSEAEAVASMEDVETIASRILQDEGHAEPPEPPQAQAPRFPDMPKGEAGQFTHVPQKLRRDWRRPAQAVLWVIAAIVAVSTVGSRMFHSVREATTAELSGDACMDNAPMVQTAVVEDEVVIGSVRISPKGIEGDTFSITDEGISIGDAFYIGPEGILMGGTYDWGVPNDTWEVPEGWVDSIYVDWTAGAAAVCAWDGDSIRFQEYSQKPLSEGQKLSQEINETTLTIENGSGSSRLLLLVPQDLELEVLDVHSSSSDVAVQDVESTVLYIETSIGNVSLTGVQADTLFASTSSGNIRLENAAGGTASLETSSGQVSGNLSAVNVSVDTASGDVSLDVEAAVELSADTTSGNVSLSPSGSLRNLNVSTSSGNVALDWSEDWGFDLGFDTASGTLDTGSMALARRAGGGGSYHWGDGQCQIWVDTASGDLRFFY